ncbi:MAG: hypothetical protein FWF88_12050, partial [Peptococcaceae bacterium]|nr:hypothetical protein [Peptococcaceae bacterium]
MADDIYIIIAEGIKAAKAAGEPVAPNVISLKDSDFAFIDMKIYKLSNELRGIADLLYNDFAGIGTQKQTEAINTYAFEYGEKSRLSFWDPLPHLPLCDEKPLKIDLFELKENIKTVKAKRDNYAAHTIRLDTGAKTVIWEGDDAEIALEQWEHIQGPGSLTQNITGLITTHIQNIEAFYNAYKEAQETIGGQGDKINIRIQKLQDIAQWLGRVVDNTMEPQEKAVKLYRSAPEILSAAEMTRLDIIKRINTEKLKTIQKTLTTTAETFETARKNAMVSRQSFSQYLQSHQPNAREYADIQRLAEGAQYKFNLLDDCWKTHLLTPVIQPLLLPLTTIWTTFTHDPNATLADTLNQTLALGQLQAPQLITGLIEIGILNKRTPELKDPTSPQAINKIFRTMGATAAPITDPTLEILIPK